MYTHKYQAVLVNEIITEKKLNTNILEYDILHAFDIFFTENTISLESFVFYDACIACHDFKFLKNNNSITGDIDNLENVSINFSFSIDFDFIENYGQEIEDKDKNKITYQIKNAIERAVDFAIKGKYNLTFTL